MQLETLGRSFQRHMRAERRSARTVETHSQGLVHFRRWLASEGLADELDSLTRINTREWLSSLVEADLSPSYIRILHTGMKLFTDWLILEEEITKNPMKGINPPALPIVPVPVIPENDLKLMIRACKGTRPMLDRRDEAIIRVLLDTGMRASELTGMTLEEMDMNQDLALVHGKGSKLRPVYFSSRTARAVDRYLRIRSTSKYANRPEVWLSIRGPLTYHGLRELLRYRASLAGVEYARPHRFRHTMANDFLANGGQERDLMRLAGWSSSAMLARYGASAADDRARQSARRLSRGDRV